MKLSFRTLTAIWTGDAQGRADRSVIETGILGSMRWWYETLVRGVGGHVCSSVGNGSCLLDPNVKLPNPLPADPAARRTLLHNTGLCDVCQLFGATGWRRRFRLIVDDHGMRKSSVWQGEVVAGGRSYVRPNAPPNTSPKTPKWYFKDGAREGAFDITLVPFGQDATPLAAALLQFMADWAAIGARAQMGMGVAALAERVSTQPLYDQLALVQGTQRYRDLPHLENMFFARIHAPSGQREEMARMRYDLRRLFEKSQPVRHALFGTVRGQRKGSKIKVSGPYGDPPEMRIWGWAAPQENPTASFDAIYAKLHTIDPQLTWRQMNCTHDSKCNHTTPLAFIADLLELTP